MWAVHFLGRYRLGSSKKSIARKPALNDAEWGTPEGTKYSSPRRQVRVALSIVNCISPSTTIPHWAPWLCSGTIESSRARNNVAEAVLPCSSHKVTPRRGVSASGNFRTNSGNPAMVGNSLPRFEGRGRQRIRPASSLRRMDGPLRERHRGNGVPHDAAATFGARGRESDGHAASRVCDRHVARGDDHRHRDGVGHPRECRRAWSEPV